ncbi:MAG: 1-acyl-sn-glycerol-3-phosphate acyltransferase [Myxococcales bacterium]|nr:1-acyl-sn-glycerol-3-phosphate acyltransferase [Myxococcales bacterium]
MLDLDRLRRIRLSKRPLGQLLVANLGLRWDYRFPRRTEIVIEGVENIPSDRGVFLAMNHTDRYNYWPLQYELYRRGLRMTATWVKGKYYEGGMTARFLDFTNNIPLPSRGYVITIEFRREIGRPPSREEYRVLRDLVDRKIAADDPLPADASADLRRFVGGDEGLSAFLVGFDRRFDAMIHEVVRLNREALTRHELNVLVFPEGTRSRRLGRGRTGLAQMSQHLSAAIVPIGCSGSDRCYPSNSPFSRGGRIVYRVGAPLEPDGPELGPYRVPPEVLPLTRAATERYGDRYEAITAVVMEKISELVDPEYRAEGEGEGGDERGVERFI